MLKEIRHIKLRKIHDQDLGSIQYLDYHENILIVLVLPYKHFKNVWFAFSTKIM